MSARSRLVALGLLALSVPFSRSYSVPKPSRTYSIGWVRIRVTNLEKANHFYKDVLGLKEFPGKCFTRDSICLWVNGYQKLELIVSPERNGPDRIGFLTDDVNSMRAYLAGRKIKTEIVQNDSGTPYCEISDPEDHHLAFVSSFEDVNYVFSPVSQRLIHAGFVVHDRAAEDKFYKDILGFHVYWHGGMKDGEDNWVDMQVPDGTDWIEYMLGVAPDASHKTLGVMNHIALGVPDIHAAREQLIKNGWKGTEEPKIGRDGKWQLNLYDPDETRVELMEFKPTKEPCCAPYTGPHPGP